MKNKKRFLKVISALVVIVLMITTFASCVAGGSSAAKDEKGTHGSLSWEYKKDNQTLTITGTGAMKNFESNENIAWGNVASSVKKLVVGEGITTVGNYAFFCMSALEEVSLPSSLVSIGKLSFAFTSSLKTIDLPASVTVIEYGAFEASGLVSVTGRGVKEIKDNAFAYCKKLTTVELSKLSENDKHKVAKNAFLESSFNKDKITQFDGKIDITFKLVDADDSDKVLDTVIVPVESGEKFVYTPKEIKGYEPVTAEVTVQVEESAKTVNVSYKKVEVETESESETALPDKTPADPKDEKLDPWTIVALVVTVLVIIGLIVGVVLFIRNDKKNGSNTRTVRKNKDEKKDKKKKK